MESDEEEEHMSKTLKALLQVLNFIIFVVGSTAGPLLLRLYYLHGGALKWLSSWILTAGWLIILLPLSISYLYRRSHRRGAKLFLMTPALCAASVGLGLITGLDSFLYACGVSYLPASTTAILSSTQLGFTALFAFLMVRHRFTVYSLAAVALLTVGAAVLGLSTSGDLPAGESDLAYYTGFFITLGAAALSGFQLPLVELTYSQTVRGLTYTMVCEVQLVMSISATVFSTVGMLVNKEFHVNILIFPKAIPKEAGEFGLGEFNYYIVLLCLGIMWQLCYLGIVGAIFYASALLAGVVQSVLLPVTDVLAIIFLHEGFTGGKLSALVLAICGSISYFYGEYKVNKKQKQLEEEQGLLDPEN